MSENSVLKKIFGPKRDKVTGELDLYSSLNIIQVMKSRTMRWVGHVAYMGRQKVHTGFWWGNLREADHLDDPEDSMKMDLPGSEIVDWIDLVQNIVCYRLL